MRYLEIIVHYLFNYIFTKDVLWNESVCLEFRVCVKKELPTAKGVHGVNICHSCLQFISSTCILMQAFADLALHYLQYLFKESGFVSCEFKFIYIFTETIDHCT